MIFMSVPMLLVLGCGGGSASDPSNLSDPSETSHAQTLKVTIGNFSTDANSQIPRINRGSVAEGTKIVEDIETNINSTITLAGADYAMFELQKIDDKHYKLAFQQPATTGDYDVDLQIKSSDGQNMTLPLKYEVTELENSLKAILKGKTFYTIRPATTENEYPAFIHKVNVSDDGK
ncbi:MAG: hypothetical protein DSZ05_06705, partial [Sulfurospirillum sp.]